MRSLFERMWRAGRRPPRPRQDADTIRISLRRSARHPSLGALDGDTAHLSRLAAALRAQHPKLSVSLVNAE
jgi:hypothetical protein